MVEARKPVGYLTKLVGGTRVKVNASQSRAPGVNLSRYYNILFAMIEITHSHKNMSIGLNDKKGLTEIRKESLNIYNRIHSIAEDILFVENVAWQYSEYPVIRALRFLLSVGRHSNVRSQQT